MRVLWVVDEMTLGGVARALCDLLTELQKGPHQHSVLVLHAHGQLLSDLPTGVEVLHGGAFFQVVDTPLSQLLRQRRWGMAARKLRLAWWLKTGRIQQVLRKVRRQMDLPAFDVEVSYKEGFCTVFTACGDTARKIAFCHADYSVFDGSKRYAPLMKACFLRHQARVAVSAQAAGALDQAFDLPGQTGVLGNIIAVERIRALAADTPDPYPPEAPRPLWLALGRMTSQKGFDRLLQAEKRLMEAGAPPHALYMVGDGPERAGLEAYARDNNLTHVVFTGNTPNPYAYLRYADALILPSRWEAQPVVVPEALAVGTPVLACDVAGVAERLGDGAGVIVDNSTEALYNALWDFLRNPAAFAPCRAAAAAWQPDHSSLIHRYNCLLGGKE